MYYLKDRYQSIVQTRLLRHFLPDPSSSSKAVCSRRILKIILNKQQKYEQIVRRYQSVIMSRKSRTDRQYNDQSRQEKRTNNLQTTTQKTNDRATRTPL